MRELKDVRYIPRMMTNLISVGALEAEGLKGTRGEGVLKISSCSLVVRKVIRHNNVYYLMGRAVTGLTSLERLDGDSTRLWHKGIGQVVLISDQALEGALTCHLESYDNCVLDKNKVKFGTVTHHLHGLLDCVHVDVWDPTKTASLKAINILSLL